MCIFNNGKTIEIKCPFYLTDESKIITKSVMIMYEYILNVKFIIINDDDGTISNFSILESLNKEKMDEYFQIKSKENLKNLRVFKSFNPLQFVLLKKEGETYKVIRELNMEDESIVSNDGSLLKKIKDAFNDEDKPREHLFVDSTSFTRLKELFEKLESVDPANESLKQPHSPNGLPPNRLNINVENDTKELEATLVNENQGETLNSINRLLASNSHLKHA